MIEGIAGLRLLQLVSPALPVGAYAYSEGLEVAVHERLVHDEGSASQWIGGRLAHATARVDGPLCARLHDAWARGDEEAVRRWSRRLGAMRESRQLRDADRDMGQALARLLPALGVSDAAAFTARDDASFPALFALAAAKWNVPRRDAVAGLLWTWLEAQIAAAIKLVPLGQTAGQRLLLALAANIPDLTDAALELEDDDLGAIAPGAALAAMRHEVLEVRLFRS